MIPTQRPLRVILLAPKRVVGGITTWTWILLKYSDPTRVQYEVLDTSKEYEPLGRKLSVRGAVLGLWVAAKRFGRLLRCLRTFRPHLVYFTCGPSIGASFRDAPYLLVLRLMGVPTVAHLQGGEVRAFFGTHWFRRLLTQRAFQSCRRVVVVAQPIARECREFLEDEQIVYIPNMLEDNVLQGAPPRTVRPAGSGRTMRLLHVAWQAPEKGSLDLVHAMQHVRHPVQCRMVGQAAPENERAILDLADRLGVRDKVLLTGRKVGQALREEFLEADLLVFPTHMEGSPNVVLEAMAYGLPAVASDVGDIRELLGADTDRPAGVLLEHVAPIDPRQTMSENGRRRVRERYLGSGVVPELENLLCRIVHGAPRRDREARVQPDRPRQRGLSASVS